MSNIKRVFCSRWYGGSILEADLSQIEVVVQAFLTQDPNMVQDVIKGVDFHVKRLAYVLGEEYDSVWSKCHVLKDPAYVKKRKDIKSFSFQRALI